MFYSGLDSLSLNLRQAVENPSTLCLWGPILKGSSSSSAFPHLTNHNEGAGNRSKVSPSRNSGKDKEVSIVNTKKPPAFRKSFLRPKGRKE